MKKLLLSLTMLFTFSLLTAQVPLNNGSFENWNGSASTQQPNGWTTALVGNIVTEVFGVQVPIPVNTYFGSRVTDAHNGSYALQLQPANVGIPGTEYNINFPGIAQLGIAGGFNIPLQTILDLVQLISGDTTGFDLNDIDPAVLSSLAQVFAPGDTCSKTPQSLNMWVKFAPASDDEAMIVAYSKLNGQPVGYAEATIDAPVNEYTYLSIPFEEAGTPCDSIVVIIMGGEFGTADLNTLLTVDDVTISPYQVGIDELTVPQFHTYPNPTTDYVRVAPEVAESYRCQLYDLQGRLLRVVESDGGQTSVDVSDLARGIYTLTIDQNGMTANHKVVVR
ncbi:MAG: T9SS type A sorting domain-containing protein [Bacteroidales bacterium]|nr:T9SS type A sorting domain-containing protein [Bacteroidales bacterium]